MKCPWRGHEADPQDQFCRDHTERFDKIDVWFHGVESSDLLVGGPPGGPLAKKQGRKITTA